AAVARIVHALAHAGAGLASEPSAGGRRGRGHLGHAGAHGRRRIELRALGAKDSFDAAADTAAVGAALGGVAAVVRVVHALAHAGAGLARDAAAGGAGRAAIHRTSAAIHR